MDTGQLPLHISWRDVEEDGHSPDVADTLQSVGPLVELLERGRNEQQLERGREGEKEGRNEREECCCGNVPQERSQ